MGINDQDFKENSKKPLVLFCDKGIERSVLLERMYRDAGFTASHYPGGMSKLVEETDEQIRQKLGGKFAILILGGREPGAPDRERRTQSKLDQLGMPYIKSDFNQLSTHIREMTRGKVEPNNYRF